MSNASQEFVSLVIPGRNCRRTIRACLDAVAPLLDDECSQLREILFIDDGSTDDTTAIVAEYPVTCITGPGGGPGAARNVGWRAAKYPLVWFVDSDCVPRPDALSLLLDHVQDASVAGVGGSYENLYPDSLLAQLIHEEIIQRHRAMSTKVNFLGGFNVLYRRDVVEQVGGFDERLFNGPGKPGAEDAELAYRITQTGAILHFEPRSIVGHHHPTRLGRYLRSQRIHGYWRVNLHLAYPRMGAGDAYSSIVDHAQPPLAVMSLVGLLATFLPQWRWLAVIPFGLLALCQVPLTLRLIRRTSQARFTLFALLSFIRAYWRGVGMTHATLARVLQRPRSGPSLRSG